MLFIVLSPLRLVYAIRAWKLFWGLRALPIFFFLFVSSLLGGLVGNVFIALVEVLFR